MRHDSSVDIGPDLVIAVRTPDGLARVRVSRLSAQNLAAALRVFSGVPSRGVELNAGTFHHVLGEAVTAQRKTAVVKISSRSGSKKRGAVYLK